MCFKVDVKNREKIPSGEDGIGTFGPAVPWKGEMLMPLSCDEKLHFHYTERESDFVVVYKVASVIPGVSCR